MKIALFSTCIGDAMFPDASKATALLLARLGHDGTVRVDEPIGPMVGFTGVVVGVVVAGTGRQPH